MTPAAAYRMGIENVLRGVRFVIPSIVASVDAEGAGCEARGEVGGDADEQTPESESHIST
ncbi:unnamed protein product [Strongylus vulgaris]|uniref:Uncharacterized protein n=1 Tax=Strongylus vulgaris TaxID=40348 RepID=A0A3P7LNJ0_STRVU|nr:unnamed protein product [Strongylus vulgaris]